METYHTTQNYGIGCDHVTKIIPLEWNGNIYGLVMDVAQYILCFVARYVNVSYRKRTVTTFSTSSVFEIHISYKTHGAYANYNFWRKCFFWQKKMSLLCPKFIFGSPKRTKCTPLSLRTPFVVFVVDKLLCKFWPS